MKIETIRARLNRIEPGTTIGPFELDLAYISTDPTMQVRDRLDDGNKRRLRSAYRAGADVPPLLVAFIEDGRDRPVVVDGHHRLNVLETLQAEGFRRAGQPMTTVQCKVVRLTAQEACYRAAMANSTHGLQLTPKESRRVFAAYVRAGHHRNENGTYKSYREIGRAMSRDHKTVSGWMKIDFPNEAAAMEKPEKATVGREDPPPAPTVLLKHVVEAKLLEVRNLFEASRSAERHHLIDGMEALLVEWRMAMDQTSDWQHDDAMDRAAQDF